MGLGLDEEQRLVELVKKDITAFGPLFEHYYDEILNYTVRSTGNVEVARDITAETFFKALRNIHKYTWKRVPFSAWLYKIAAHEIAAYYRKGVYRVASLDDLQFKGFEPVSPYNLEEEVLAAEKTLQKHEDWLMCCKAVQKLPGKYQDVITLRFFAGKKISEISVILDKPEGTVKSLLHRGLKRLRIIFFAEKRNLF